MECPGGDHGALPQPPVKLDCRPMGGLNSLWRIRGAAPIPASADDDGLLSRLAGVLEDGGHKIADDGPDWIVFEQPRWLLARPWWLADETGPGEVGPFDPGEIRRHGVKGRRVLRYDFSLIPELPMLAFEGVSSSALFAWILPEIVGIPSTVAASAAAIIAFYALRQFQWRKGIHQSFERAFEN